MKSLDDSVITESQVKVIYPEIGETAAKLMMDYMNLTRVAVKLNMLEKSAVSEIEERHQDLEEILERLHYQSADVLSLLKGLVDHVQVPADPKEFEDWMIHSDEYPKVICHDAFFDVFIASKKALAEGK